MHQHRLIRRFLAAIILTAALTAAATPPVPGYAPADGDHRFSQTLRGIIIGGSGTFIATGLIGLYRNRDVLGSPDGSFYDLEPVAVAATTFGFFGSALGALFGYATGVEQNGRYAADSSFVPPLAAWGPRILLIFSNNPRFHLCCRLPENGPFMPDRLRAGFMYRPRNGYAAAGFSTGPIGNAEDEGFMAMEFDWDAAAIWQYKTFRKLTPYAGLAGGHAQLRHFDLEADTHTDLSSPYLRLLGGIELNASDYLFLEVEAMHEVFGTQRLISKYGYHASWNSSVYLYVGSYFF